MAFVLQFQIDFNVQVSTKFTFTKLFGVDPHAYCSLDRDEVVIHKPHWDKISVVEKRELIYHELGHCVLDLRHPNPHCRGEIRCPRTYDTLPTGENWEELLSRMKLYLRKERK